MLSSDISLRDYAYLKKLGNSYKLIKCNEVRKSGYECVKVNTFVDDVISYEYYDKGLKKHKLEIHKKTVVDFSRSGLVNGCSSVSNNDEKLANNITRARNKILEYVLCNEFVFFVTLTLSPDKYDRHNLSQFIKDLSIFIRDYNKRKNASIKYLFIPEQHNDGSWHMHGFIMGLPYDRLELFDLHGDKNLPKYIVDKLKNNELLYYFPAYEKKFGYNIFEPIRNKKASALYMCKYLTKDLSRNVRELGYHLYYCSKGLKKAEIVKQGQFLDSDFNFDFSNEYGGQSFFDFLSEEDLENIKDKIGGSPVSLDDYRRGYIKNDGWQQYIDNDTGEIIGDIPEELEGSEVV